MLGSKAAVAERSRMHCVTSLKTVKATPGFIRTEAYACAKTRPPAARIQSFDRSVKRTFLPVHSRRGNRVLEVTSVTTPCHGRPFSEFGGLAIFSLISGYGINNIRCHPPNSIR